MSIAPGHRPNDGINAGRPWAHTKCAREACSDRHGDRSSWCRCVSEFPNQLIATRRSLEYALIHSWQDLHHKTLVERLNTHISSPESTRSVNSAQDVSHPHLHGYIRHHRCARDWSAWIRNRRTSRFPTIADKQMNDAFNKGNKQGAKEKSCCVIL